MEIVWYGHSCFRISERGKGSVVTDPFDAAVAGYGPLKLKSEIVTVSCNDPVHNYSKTVKGDPLVISGPGEYEVSGVFITGMHTVSEKKETDGPRNTLYIMDFGTLTVAHLGRVSHSPTQSDVEAKGSVNIALVPIGDGASLNAAKDHRGKRQYSVEHGNVDKLAFARVPALNNRCKQSRQSHETASGHICHLDPGHNWLPGSRARHWKDAGQ